MAFSRHNIEKRRLIELVRLNPILWDCRLPHYKRSDKKKAIKWNELGRLFNVNGERVQRTFTSLREIFRRELNHEKMLGTRFKSKWEYYDAMAFLKEVIRERKSRERVKNTDAPNALNNNSNCIDEYQYFAPSDPNNPNNQPTVQANPTVATTTTTTTPTSKLQETLMKPLNLPPPPCLTALQLPAASSAVTAGTVSIAQLPPQIQQQAQHLHALQLQPDVTLTLQKYNTQQQQQQQQQQEQTPAQSPLNATAPTIMPNPTQASSSLVAVTPPHVLSSSRSCSSSPSIYIKDEPDSNEEETTSLTTTSNGKCLATHRTKLTTHAPNARIKTQHSTKANSAVNAPLSTSKAHLIKGAAAVAVAAPSIVAPTIYTAPPNVGNIDFDDDDDDDDDDDFDDIGPTDVDMLDERSVLSSLNGMGAGAASRLHQLSAREILYTKFGDFLAARLNTLNESVANELMNKILLLIAEK